MVRSARPRANLLGVAPALIAVLLVSLSCTGPDEAGQNRKLVLTTTSIWADIVANITCDGLVEVVSIVPAGADPHSFEPSLADRSLMDKASVVVVNGLGLESGLQDTLDAAQSDGASIVKIGDRIQTLTVDGLNPDPHIWFDPTGVSDVLPWLAERLASKANLDPAIVNQCVTEYQSELRVLDEDLSGIFNSIPKDRRKLVTNHDSLEYLANRYGLQILDTVLPSSSSLAETSPGALEVLARKIEAEGVKAIFTEAQASSDDAQALANRLIEVEIIELNTGSLGPENSTSATYLDFMRTNAELIAVGLG